MRAVRRLEGVPGLCCTALRRAIVADSGVVAHTLGEAVQTDSVAIHARLENNAKILHNHPVMKSTSQLTCVTVQRAAGDVDTVL